MRRRPVIVAVVATAAALLGPAAAASAAPSTRASCVAQLIPVLGPLGNPEHHVTGEEASSAAKLAHDACGL